MKLINKMQNTIKTNATVKSYLIWFLVMNIISFGGGFVDALIWIPFGEKGGNGGFPVFTIIGIYAGAIGWIVFSLINTINKKISKEIKLSQVIASIIHFVYPILTLLGIIVGWIVGYILVKIF